MAVTTRMDGPSAPRPLLAIIIIWAVVSAMSALAAFQ
jgi:hypothetical protein